MGQCNCFPDYHGKDCSLKYCPKNCTGHGTCRQETGACICDLGWESHDCSNKRGSDGGASKATVDSKKIRDCERLCNTGCVKECDGDNDTPGTADPDKASVCLKECTKDCKMSCFADVTGPVAPPVSERPLHPDLESNGRWNGEEIDNNENMADPAQVDKASEGASIFGTLFGGGGAASASKKVKPAAAASASAPSSSSSVFVTAKEAGTPDRRGQRTEAKIAAMNVKADQTAAKESVSKAAALPSTSTTLKAMQYNPATADKSAKVAASQAGYDATAVIAKPLSSASDKTASNTATTSSLKSLSVSSSIEQSKSSAEKAKEAEPVPSKAEKVQTAKVKREAASVAAKAQLAAVKASGVPAHSSNAHDEYGPGASVLGSTAGAMPDSSSFMSSLFGWKESNTAKAAKN
jgi:hypothetical protein